MGIGWVSEPSHRETRSLFSISESRFASRGRVQYRCETHRPAAWFQTGRGPVNSPCYSLPRALDSDPQCLDPDPRTGVQARRSCRSQVEGFAPNHPSHEPKRCGLTRKLLLSGQQWQIDRTGGLWSSLAPTGEQPRYRLPFRYEYPMAPYPNCYCET